MQSLADQGMLQHTPSPKQTKFTLFRIHFRRKTPISEVFVRHREILDPPQVIIAQFCFYQNILIHQKPLLDLTGVYNQIKILLSAKKLYPSNLKFSLRRFDGTCLMCPLSCTPPTTFLPNYQHDDEMPRSITRYLLCNNMYFLENYLNLFSIE